MFVEDPVVVNVICPIYAPICGLLSSLAMSPSRLTYMKSAGPFSKRSDSALPSLPCAVKWSAISLGASEDMWRDITDSAAVPNPGWYRSLSVYCAGLGVRDSF